MTQSMPECPLGIRYSVHPDCSLECGQFLYESAEDPGTLAWVRLTAAPYTTAGTAASSSVGDVTRPVEPERSGLARGWFGGWLLLAVP